MNGLVAVVSREPHVPVSEDELAGLLRAYGAVRRGDARAHASAGTAARVTLIGTADRVPEIETAGASWVACVGRPHSSVPLTKARVEDLDGQFAFVSYDAALGEVRVAVDAFGMQSLFVAERGAFTYVSTSALALARFLSTPPDRFALETFLRAGYHFGARTNWHGIERLEPAEYRTFGASGTTRGIYWRPHVDEDIARLPLADAADHCIGVATAACREAFGALERPWIDLTGGFDSRLLALLLEAAEVSFVGNTRGDAGDSDRRIAAEIADLKSWDLFAPTLPHDWNDTVPDLVPLTVAWGDGHLQALEPAWVLEVHRLLSDRSTDLLSGGGGEHWRGFAWAQEFLRAGRSTRVNLDNWVDMRLLHPMSTNVFARDVTDEIRDDFRTRMTAWATPYADAPNTVQLDVMYAYKVTGHFGAYKSADEAWLTAQLPFYFKPLFSAAFSVDHRHRSGHRLMRRAIWQLDQATAAIGTATGGPAMPLSAASAHRFAPYYARLAQRAVTKLTQKTIRRGLFAPRHASWWAPQSTRAAVVDLLGATAADRRRTMRSLRLYDDRALDNLLAEARRAPVFDAELLGRITSVELALRHADASLDA